MLKQNYLSFWKSSFTGKKKKSVEASLETQNFQVKDKLSLDSKICLVQFTNESLNIFSHETGSWRGWRQLPSSLLFYTTTSGSLSTLSVAAKQSNISLWIITPKVLKNSVSSQNKVFDVIHQLINFRLKVTKLYAVKRQEPRSGGPLFKESSCQADENQGHFFKLRQLFKS